MIINFIERSGATVDMTQSAVISSRPLQATADVYDRDADDF